ncbi:FG-GAP-like repeat-containing protein [Streptomonospora sp. PA3]|uniref:FG-GAP-like repeat-containing protein n=1 Tax=Streptomonospora sp. PA3 TaxID=2607326 RepID=UPI001642C24B|nr:FG-GAP repeat protein [Streptomonospora sp. PA3]
MSALPATASCLACLAATACGGSAAEAPGSGESPAPPVNLHPEPGPVSPTPAAGGSPGAGTDPPVDFNGDGYSDLAIRTWDEPFFAGAVLGGESGLDPDRRSVLTPEDLGVADVGAPPVLGPFLRTTADLDDDGYTDMVVSADRGYVLWGGPDGLAEQPVPLPWLETDPGADSEPPTTTMGDFDGDGDVDVVALDLLFLPTRYETVLLRGPFDRSGAPSSTEDLPLPVRPEEEGVSSELVAFAADTDPATDLVLLRNYDESPAPHLVLRSDGGPAAGILGETPAGHDLAGGDFDGDDVPDLAVGTHGVPDNENELGEEDPELHPGRVDVYSGADGFAAGEPVRVTRATPGVPGEAQDADGFGGDLIAADVHGDGYDDVVVGLSDPHRGDTSGGKQRFAVLSGGPEGVARATGVSLTLPDPPEGAEQAEDDPPLWSPEALRDYNGDGAADLLLQTDAGEFARYALYPANGEGFAESPQVVFSTRGWGSA